MRVSRRQFTSVAASVFAIAQFGCVTSPDRSLLQNNVSKQEKSLLERLPLLGKNKEDEAPEPYPNPVRLAVTWTPDTLVQTGRTPTRGFGGRVFFYDEKSRPVPVEGALMVHGFDDSSEDPEEGVKRFAFTSEQFTRHFSQSDLGASYSIWIPWDAIGGDQKRISLVTSFQTAAGNTVQGTPATLLLPGKNTSLDSTDQLARYSPQYQEYLAATNSSGAPQSGLMTTTIQRSRPLVPGAEIGEPAINIPAARKRSSMLAGQGGTPSYDLGGKPVRNARPTRSTVLPASAQLPMSK